MKGITRIPGIRCVLHSHLSYIPPLYIGIWEEEVDGFLASLFLAWMRREPHDSPTTRYGLPVGICFPQLTLGSHSARCRPLC